MTIGKWFGDTIPKMFSDTTIHDLVRWTGGELFFCPNDRKTVTSLSTDSRSLKAGEVFVALRGENYDGHKFLTQAAEKGALLLLSEEKIQNSLPQLIVHNSLIALSDIAKNLRSHFTGPVVSITGSAGKSSTKDMLATLLGEKTLKSPASFNNLLGVSKTLCLIQDSTEQIVLEMGMSGLGEIKEMCEIFEPTLGCITNIGEAHLGKLGTQEGIYTAKKELFDWLAKNPKSEGIALNLDDALVCKAFKTITDKKIKTVAYSALGNPEAQVKLSHQELDPSSAFLKLTIEIEKEILNVSVPIFGLHHSNNLLAAVSLALLRGVSVKEIKKRLPELKPALHRGEIHKLKDGKVLIDESYNSNPIALASSLETLKQVDWAHRMVIVIGQMNELGDFSKEKHTEAGTLLVKLFGKKNIHLITVGKECDVLIESICDKVPGWTLNSFADVKELAAQFAAFIQTNDLIYLKGSNGIRLFDLIPFVQ